MECASAEHLTDKPSTCCRVGCFGAQPLDTRGDCGLRAGDAEVTGEP
jgi:hypothetical protein